VARKNLTRGNPSATLRPYAPYLAAVVPREKPVGLTVKDRPRPAGDSPPPLTQRQYDALNPERQEEARDLGLVMTAEQQAAYDQDRAHQAELRRDIC
jgi:hypothetical protein